MERGWEVEGGNWGKGEGRGEGVEGEGRIGKGEIGGGKEGKRGSLHQITQALHVPPAHT